MTILYTDYKEKIVTAARKYIKLRNLLSKEKKNCKTLK